MIETDVNPATILASVGVAAYRWDIDGDRLTWTTNVRDVLRVGLGCSIDSGQAFAALLESGGRQRRIEAVMRSPLQDAGDGVPYQLEYALAATSEATPLWIEDCGRWFAGDDGKPCRAHGLIRVVTERHEQAERLTYLSRFDPLTGEMNRQHLIELLETTIEHTGRLRGSCGFLIVAIDNLSGINQAYGYDVADEMIGAIGARLRSKMRGKDHLGRYSGNKFGVILNDCSPEDMTIASERLIAGVRDEVVMTQAGAIAATITIGGVTAPRHARDLREVLARAHDALDNAKLRRRGSFHAYQPNLERDARRAANVRTTEEIVSALNERRISLVFEPVVSVASRQPVFYESLIRIGRADGSPVPNKEIVPAAERLGLVRLLDQRVLELVVEEMAKAPNLHASLNVSPPSTTDPDWWSAFGARLRFKRDVAERLTVEITETAAIHDLDDTRGFVARVKELGCQIAIDDFGAGYTSFRNLRRLGVDIVKIDGAFVQNLARSEDDRAFVRSLVELARRLQIKTVAEWVQDEESAALLAEWGCDYLQGDLIGRASPHKPWRDEPSVRASA